MIPGWAQDYNQLLERYGVDLPRANAGLYMAYAVIMLLPFVSGIAVLVLLPMVISQTCDAVNRLHAARSA